MELPLILLAPNGARKTKADHPRLPITVQEVINETREAVAQGAGGLHAHIRDAAGKHSLDTGLYREMLEETERAFPGLFIQVTTEAVGLYSADYQRQLVRDLRPSHVSIGMKEIMSDGDMDEVRLFYAFCAAEGIAVQHILYDEDQCREFLHHKQSGLIPGPKPQVIHVLGRYSVGQVSDPADVAGRVAILSEGGLDTDWSLCAFGRNETACLLEAIRLGGKARIGFENNLEHPDGRIAESNADRVRDLVSRLN